MFFLGRLLLLYLITATNYGPFFIVLAKGRSCCLRAFKRLNLYNFERGMASGHAMGSYMIWHIVFGKVTMLVIWFRSAICWSYTMHCVR